MSGGGSTSSPAEHVRGWHKREIPISNYIQPLRLHQFNEFKINIYNLKRMSQFLESFIIIPNKYEFALDYNIQVLVLFHIMYPCVRRNFSGKTVKHGFIKR